MRLSFEKKIERYIWDAIFTFGKLFTSLSTFCALIISATDFFPPDILDNKGNSSVNTSSRSDGYTLIKASALEIISALDKDLSRKKLIL